MAPGQRQGSADHCGMHSPRVPADAPVLPPQPPACLRHLPRKRAGPPTPPSACCLLVQTHMCAGCVLLRWHVQAGNEEQSAGQAGSQTLPACSEQLGNEGQHEELPHFTI